MRLKSLHTLLALAAIRDLNVIQFDITSAYLHDTLKEGLYMERLEGYKAPGKRDWVWRLKKGLYGLEKAGRTWEKGVNSHMVSEGLAATPKDPAVYVKIAWNQEYFVAGVFWVDDFVRMGFWKGPRGISEGGQREVRDYWPRGGQIGSRMLLERDYSTRMI